MPVMASEGKPRRIITAQDADGRTRLARVEEVPQVSGATLPADVLARNYPPGAPDVRVVWGTEELPFALPADPDPPSVALPGPRGIRVSVTTFPPGWTGEMFWSERVDVLWVMSGELTYVTDGGDEVVVEPGDIVIQNGANKAFHNRGAEPVRMGAVMCGAVFAGATPPMSQYHGPPRGPR
jgi:quercetin dioxygenase-like cupin family protein